MPVQNSLNSETNNTVIEVKVQLCHIKPKKKKNTFVTWIVTFPFMQKQQSKQEKRIVFFFFSFFFNKRAFPEQLSHMKRKEQEKVHG